MKKIILVCLNIFLVFLLMSCGSNVEYSTSTGYSASNSSTAAYPASERSYSNYDAGGGEQYFYEQDESSFETYVMAEGSVASTERQQKKIITCDIFMESNSFDAVFQQMKDITVESGGYVQDSQSSVSGYSNSGRELKRGSLTLRIPSDGYKDVKAGIEALGKVVTVSERTSDETNAYYDINARLTRKKLEEERLLAMIEDAKALKDLIELESRLTDVRTEIEMYQSSMRNIDRQSSYSTITVSLTEKVDAELTYVSDDLQSRIKNSFISSLNGTIDFFAGVIVFLASIIVPVGIIGVICLSIFFIWRLIKAKKGD